MKKLIMILTCIIASVGLSVAQTTRVSGTILDDTGETVIGASVVAKGTTVGTVTDIDGNFSLNIPSDKKTLVISLIGMKTKEVAAGTDLKIILENDSKLMDEVVVTGYGLVKKATFTGSATTVQSKALTDITSSSVDKALQGNSAGLLTQAASGQPGAGQRIVVRGLGSVNAGTEPLWIVDGVPIATGNFGQLTSTGETTYSDNSNALAGINPNDIESITVLKDASATSIYGARAANGVVVVTTKSGIDGKTRFSLSSNYGWSRRATNNFKVMNKAQYTEYMTEALFNSGGYSSLDEAQQDLFDTFPKDANGNSYNFNWMDRTYRNDAPTYSFDISANGGNAKTKFFVSAGYFNQEGILEASAMNRISNKFNITHAYSNKLRFGLSSTLSLTKQETPLTTSSYYSNPVLASAIIPALDPGEIDGVPTKLTVLSANFLANIKYNYANSRTYRVIESAFVEYDLLEGLTFKTQWGVDFMQVNEAQWDDPRVPGNTASTLGGRATRTGGESLVWNITNTLNYNKVFDKVHNLNVMVGQEANDDSYRYQIAASEGFPTPDFQELTAGANPVTAESDYKHVRLFSLFTRVNYAYDNKYILSTSFRRDGSSRFSKDNLYSNFWSVGGQWRMSQENFLQNVEWLTNLGLRASYGTSGNSDVTTFTTAGSELDGRHPALGLYSGGANYNGVSGIYPLQMVNNDLKWESTASFNVGVDFSAFNNRLSTTLEFYNKNTTDLLFRVPVSSTTGFTTAMRNVGSMRNRGVEWTISGVPVVTKDFEWTVSFNISHNKNKVTELYGGQDIITTNRIKREGEDVQSIYTYEWAGVDPDDGAPMWYAEDGSKVKSISKANRRIVGSAAPKYFGGLTNTFKYKGFDLSALFYFNQGNKISDQTLAMVNAFGARGLWNQSPDVLNRWQKPGDITDVPKVIYGVSPSVYAPMSTRYVYDGSFIRLRNLNIGYTLPNVPGLRIYFQGTNLLTFTDYKGLDPEVGINGDPWFGYPVAKTMTFGFNYNF
ncbi:TonB-dependent receptor [Dysgonomonas sp. HDW5B]|uniref:SusC/RagA family TonB-linked outer membrane protein n=1 Tax=Dysgonomonas sp. HDW5B TaxID=2714927 RepID=UPI0014099F5D|nr:TonB-dependent receptor [Dysgonomonas sp. HDW5B]QIK53652.1 TonB-dependent receptor [Dysgonomonas sp. HDW5B]